MNAVIARQSYVLRLFLSLLCWGALAGADTMVTSCSLRQASAGQPYAFQLHASGNGPWLWSLTQGALPAGVHLDTASGALAGSPIAGGDYAFAVVASNASGSSPPQALRLHVREPAPLLTWPVLYSGSIPLGRRDLVQVAAGSDVSMGLTREGEIVAWGASVFLLPIPVGLTDVSSIAVNAYNALALTDQGHVWAWGYESMGLTEVPPGLASVTAVAIGSDHCVALQEDGTVVAWGWNGAGQTDVPPGLRAIAVAAGGVHTLALCDDGTVVAWGDQQTDQQQFGPADVPTGLTGVVSIAAGGYHSLALRSDGTVVAWGDDSHGQVDVPAGLSGVVAISAGSYHSLALCSDGRVVAWGGGGNGEGHAPPDLAGATAIAAGNQRSYALGYFPPHLQMPAQVSAVVGTPLILPIACDTPVTEVQASGLPDGLSMDGIQQQVHGSPTTPGVYAVTVTASNPAGTSSATLSMVVTIGAITTYSLRPMSVGRNASQLLHANVPDGTVWSIHAGTLPDGIVLDAATGLVHGTPQAAGDFDVSVEIAHGAWHSEPRSLRLHVNPQSMPVHSWGNHAPSDLPGPVPVGKRYGQVVASGLYVDLVVLPDGTVASWGYFAAAVDAPPSGLADVCSVAMKLDDALALTGSGSVVAWGANLDGQCNVPAGLSQVTAISSGSCHSLALREDGSVLAWGAADHGMHDYGQSRVPGSVVGAVAVAAGGRFSVAACSDGHVEAWGEPGLPVLLVPAGLTDVIALAAGQTHCLALRRDGTVVAWGQDSSGNTAVPIGLSDVVSISAGSMHSLALRRDGQVVVWGGDPYYHQGDTPAGLGGAAAISAGAVHSLALGYVPPVMTSAGFATAVVGTTFSFRLAAANDPLSFASSSLPPGLTLDPATGVISGTAELLGSTEVTVSATNPAGTDDGTLHIDVIAVDLQTYVLRDGLRGHAYREVLQAQAAGSVAWSMVAGVLPDGLALDASTGIISGTPLAAGEFRFSVQADAPAGSSAVRHLRLQVNGAAPVVAWGARPELRPSPLGQLQAAAIVGAADHTFTLLPDGTVTDWGHTSSPAVVYRPGYSGIVAIAGAAGYGLALAGDGSVVGWTSSSSADLPVPLPRPFSRVAQIAAGESVALALHGDGTVEPWRGFGYTPVPVPSGLGQVVAIAAGDGHFLALRYDGTVTAWGDDAHGQTDVPPGLNHVVAIAAGGDVSLAVTDAGRIVAWGDDGNAIISSVPTTNTVIRVSTNGQHALALNGDGTVIGWGANGDGQSVPPTELAGVTATAAGWACSTVIGYLPPEIRSPMNLTVVAGVPVSVPILADYAPSLFAATGLPGGMQMDATIGLISGQASLPGSYSVALAATNPAGSDMAMLSLEVLAAQIQTYSVRPGALARPYRCALMALGSAPLSWSITMGALPPGLALDAATGVVAGVPQAPGVFHCTVRVENGHGTSPDRRLRFVIERSAIPVIWGDTGAAQASIPADLDGALDLALGAYHVLALRGDGRVRSWGWDTDGQGSVPAALDNVVAVSAGSLHSLALRDDGTVVQWGRATNGVPPLDLSDVTAISAGAWHSLALRADGSVVSWGNNAAGQSTVPPSLSRVVAISAGGEHCLALQYDGSVIAWGGNTYGQCVPPGGLVATDIAAGGYHSLALSGDGTLHSWGSIASPPTPTGAIRVGLAGGGGHSLLLHEDGTLQAWGMNQFGQSTVPAGFDHAVRVAAFGYTSAATQLQMPVFTSPMSATAHVGSLFSFRVAATSSPTFALTGLPAWLSFDPCTGMLSGIPVGIESLSFPVSATNEIGTANAVLTLGVLPAIPVITSPLSASGMVGVAFAAYHIAATQSPYGYSALGVPPGLFVSSAGVISGTPTLAGSYPVAIGATNDGGTGTAVLNITILPAAQDGSGGGGDGGGGGGGGACGVGGLSGLLMAMLLMLAVRRQRRPS